MKELDKCTLCPRACGVNRNAGYLGYCGSDARYHIGSICIHHGEEPPISGPMGICNIFFTGCNLQCVYCQNYQISRRKNRLEDTIYTLEQVTDAVKNCLDRGIEAVGFVSPTHYTPHVKAIINKLHQLGYTPITVYNTNSYDNVNIIRSFDGLIDVYLPDFKYMDSGIAFQYSDAADYPELAKEALKEMFRQKGSTVVLNEKGQAVTGMIIRHLVLPGQSEDSVRILEWIAEELSVSVAISLMSQYYPTPCVMNHPVLGRKISYEEYQVVVDAMEYLGFYKGWIQDYESSHTYRPDFSHRHPFEEE